MDSFFSMAQRASLRGHAPIANGKKAEAVFRQRYQGGSGL